METPLLALSPDLFYATSNAFGVFGNSSVNGEYNMMMVAFLIPLLRPSLLRQVLNVGPRFLTAVVLLCLANIVLSNTRGSAILAALIIVFYGFMFSMIYRRVHGVLSNLNVIVLLLALVLLSSGALLGISNLVQDFQKVGEVSIESVTSGKALNRFGIWQMAWDRLTQEGWLIGYGHGVPKSNWVGLGRTNRRVWRRRGVS